MSRATRSPGAVLVGASAAQASVSLVNFGLPAIGPQLSDEFDMSLFWLGAVLAAGLLGSGIALIVAGHRRRPAGRPPRDDDRNA